MFHSRTVLNKKINMLRAENQIIRKYLSNLLTGDQSSEMEAEIGRIDPDQIAEDDKEEKPES